MTPAALSESRDESASSTRGAFDGPFPVFTGTYGPRGDRVFVQHVNPLRGWVGQGIF